jgi:hypothetical protein
MTKSSMLVLSVACVLGGACKKTVKTGEVATAVQNQLASQGVQAKVSCPDGVEGKKGQKFVCTAEVEGDKYDVDVEITEVKDDQAMFNTQMREVLGRDAVVAGVTKQVSDQLGAPVTLDCGAKKIMRIVNGEITCAADVGGHKGKMTVKASPEGQLGEFKIVFDEGPSLMRQKVIELLVPAVEAKIGSKPEIDCGTDALLFPKDNKILCKVTAGGQVGGLRVDTEGETIKGWEIVKDPPAAPAAPQ